MSRLSRLLTLLTFWAALISLPGGGHAAQVVAPTGAPLNLEVSKGRLVHLDHPAASVFVADPEIADIQVKSPSLVYVFGKSAGETTLYAVGENDQLLLSSAVVVRHNLAKLQQALKTLVPGTAVNVSTVDDQLVLEGTVYSAADGEDIRRIAARFVPAEAQLINKMKVSAPNQVNIRVRIAEMSRETIKEFGFNWDALFQPGNFKFGLAQGISTLTGTGAFNTRTSVTTNTTLNNVFGGFSKGKADLNVLIDALDNHGLVTILAEPNLSALSGEPASFLAGGEFPVPVPQSNSSITIEFKKFGVGLNFVATILGDRVSLRVQPEVSQLSTAGSIIISNIQVPSLTTRRADTTVELASGQSIAIAGLLQNNVTQDINKFPWLGDVPVVGQLFRSDRFRRDESELVIIVTPYIVRPVTTANRLQTPLDGFNVASDREAILYGNTYKPQALKQRNAPLGRDGTALVGPAGFDLD